MKISGPTLLQYYKKKKLKKKWTAAKMTEKKNVKEGWEGKKVKCRDVGLTVVVVVVLVPHRFKGCEFCKIEKMEFVMKTCIQ